jgi:hypothetical protein
MIEFHPVSRKVWRIQRGLNRWDIARHLYLLRLIPGTNINLHTDSPVSFASMP